MLQKKKVIPSTRMTTSSRCNKVTEGLITIFMSGVQYRMGAVKSVYARELRGHSVRSHDRCGNASENSSAKEELACMQTWVCI